MTKREKLSFDSIPSWITKGVEKHDRYTVASVFKLAELDGKWVRLTAEAQRVVFGANLFGKCRILVGDDGVEVVRSVCFGTDFSSARFSWSEFERVMETGKRPAL